MKNASGALAALLNGNTEFLMADLYTLTLWDGTIKRWTDADQDIVFNGSTFRSVKDQDTATPILARGTTRCVVGLEVDTLDVTLKCGQTVLIGA